MTRRKPLVRFGWAIGSVSVVVSVRPALACASGQAGGPRRERLRNRFASRLPKNRDSGDTGNKEIPKLDTNGTLSCACKDKRWVKRKGARGTEEERLMLTGKGFREAEDLDGDVYYLGPGWSHSLAVFQWRVVCERWGISRAHTGSVSCKRFLIPARASARAKRGSRFAA